MTHSLRLFTAAPINPVSGIATGGLVGFRGQDGSEAPSAGLTPNFDALLAASVSGPATQTMAPDLPEPLEPRPDPVGTQAPQAPDSERGRSVPAPGNALPVHEPPRGVSETLIAAPTATRPQADHAAEPPQRAAEVRAAQAVTREAQTIPPPTEDPIPPRPVLVAAHRVLETGNARTIVAPADLSPAPQSPVPQSPAPQSPPLNPTPDAEQTPESADRHHTNTRDGDVRAIEAPALSVSRPAAPSPLARAEDTAVSPLTPQGAPPRTPREPAPREEQTRPITPPVSAPGTELFERASAPPSHGLAASEVLQPGGEAKSAPIASPPPSAAPLQAHRDPPQRPNRVPPATIEARTQAPGSSQAVADEAAALPPSASGSAQPSAPSLTAAAIAGALPAASLAPTPLNGAAEPRPPIALDAVVDHLVEARENGRAARSDLTVRHADFGAVSVRLENVGSEVRATLSNRDPGFVPAIQAALMERGVASGGEVGSGTSQRGQEQSSQNGAGTGSGGSSLGRTGAPVVRPNA